jgi:hypothetical protein
MSKNINVIDLDIIIEENLNNNKPSNNLNANKSSNNLNANNEIIETKFDILDNTLENKKKSDNKLVTHNDISYNETKLNNNDTELNNSLKKHKSIINRAVVKFKNNKNNKNNKNKKLSYINSSNIKIGYEMDFKNLKNDDNLKILDDIYNDIENNLYINEKKELLNKIYKIFKDKTYIMFVKKKKLSFYDEINCMGNCIPFYNSKRCSNINFDDFHGCLFLPIEDIEKFLKLIDYYNKIISNNLINCKEYYYNKDETYLTINFDENNLKKNYLYKRVDILNKITFISIKDYQTKMTEYKIRGLCQIAEELGANEINIYFEKNLKNTILKESTINMEINSIAGNLGFKRGINDSKNENSDFKLTYSSINNIELNDYKLINKIKKHKFIISEKIFNSNLELQYLISSRCRHFITEYSTTFNIDTETIVDKEIEAKFKKAGYAIGMNIKNNKTISNHLKIHTNIKFNSIDEYYPFITGLNVPFNECGFNHLMLAINREPEYFNEKGIFKIINFIDGYIKRILRFSLNDIKYKKIVKLITLIKSRMTLEEYANSLFYYFDLNSTWTQFIYFINVLSDEATSIDDINYLIIYEKLIDSTNNFNCHDLFDNILELIQNKCKKLDIEDKFNNMLRPTSMKTKFILKYFLLHDYKLLNTFNLYGLNNIINNIKKYTIYIEDINYNNIELNGEDGNKLTKYKYFTLDEYDIKNEKFIILYKNMNLGFNLWEFYNNMMSYIHEIYLIIFNYKIEQKEIQIKNKIYYNDLFNNIVNYFDFKSSNITNFKLLNDYINDCINIIKLGLNMRDDILNEFKKQENEKDIKKFFMNYIICNTKYSYFTIKLNFIINNNYNNLKDYFEKVYNSSIINDKFIVVQSSSYQSMLKSQGNKKVYLGDIKKTNISFDNNSSFDNTYNSNSSSYINNPSFDNTYNMSFSRSFDDNEDRDSELIISNNEKFVYNIIRNIITYNHREINIDNIPLNSFGYNIIIKNYKVGIPEIEFNKLILPFCNNIIKYILEYNKIDIDKIDYLSNQITITYFNFDNYLNIYNYKYKYFLNFILDNIINIINIINLNSNDKNKEIKLSNNINIPNELC